MFRRILIANRGEIACRIARTASRLGVESVAVHSRADAGALHVHATTHAVALGGTGPADGYLDGEQIIRAAKATGAEAIHPGYGFLSENAPFAAACEAAGIVFVGPGADVIRDMGDKARARRLAREAGVAVVPGVEEPAAAAAAHRDAALVAAARGLEYPLMVKACAGGGGRGMRRVDARAELGAAIALARAEARAGFGDDRLLIERFVPRARHVEVQVLGDGHGGLVHLHERDCSIQRRHQKLIEEAPAPGLAARTRDALHAAALTLARAIGYRNAGTVEFIVDPRDETFFFLEMNTRLQVEHPVTEAILGLDLVEWQLRVAAGETLPFAQHELAPSGWAMEARINAEDPATGFQPCAGTVLGFDAPQAPGVRLDSGVGEGSEVLPYYDSLLAKLVVHGADRSDAAARLAGALDRLAVMGLRTNTAFLADLVRRPEFVAGNVHTAFIPEQYPHGWGGSPGREDLAVAAAWWRQARAGRGDGPWHRLRGFRLLADAGHPGRWRRLLADDDGVLHAVWMLAAPDGLRAAVTGADAPAPRPTDVVAGRCGGGRLAIRIGERVLDLAVLERGGSVHLHGPSGWHAFGERAAADATSTSGAAAGDGAGPLAAPVPGVVASVAVAEGDRVAAGAPLLALESMKMLQTLSAPCAARVATLHCVVGDAVTVGQVLLVLEPCGDGASEPEP